MKGLSCLASAALLMSYYRWGQNSFRGQHLPNCNGWCSGYCARELERRLHQTQQLPPLYTPMVQSFLQQPAQVTPFVMGAGMPFDVTSFVRLGWLQTMLSSVRSQGHGSQPSSGVPHHALQSGPSTRTRSREQLRVDSNPNEGTPTENKKADTQLSAQRFPAEGSTRARFGLEEPIRQSRFELDEATGTTMADAMPPPPPPPLPSPPTSAPTTPQAGAVPPPPPPRRSPADVCADCTACWTRWCLH